uniref:Uncharacterized protein n=1 Tax=Opuntia streptacantha TaxID=393608 RepID=A0A7C9DWD9_OPUST
MISPKLKYLVGNLVLNCPSSLVLITGNRILNDCGKCLFCCISLALCGQILNSFLLEPICYTHCDIVSSFVLLDGLTHDSSCGYIWLLLVCFSIELRTFWCVVLG